MGLKQADESPVELVVENIGGISETTVRFSPGVTVLTGRNATNRTSFLRALMAALGSDEATIKGDATEGLVELTIDGDTHTRVLSDRDGTTGHDGNPYLDDAELSNLFAFLLESNDARQAIERGEDLYDIIMRPVDTADIDAQIDRLETERDELEAELETLTSLEERLPVLEAQRTQLEGDIEAKRDELETNRSELDELEVDAGTPSELENRLEELRDARGELEDIRDSIEDEERIVEALRDDKDSVESDLDGLASVDEDVGGELEATISRHRESLQSIESALADLQSVIQFNESLLEGEAPRLLETLLDEADGDTEGSVTDKLLEEGEDVVCWTCGSQVEREEIERTVDLLRDVHGEKIDQRNALREEVNELEAERKHLERTVEEHRRLTSQLNEVKAELENRTDRITDLKAGVEDLEDIVEGFEAEIEDLEMEGNDNLLELHRRVNETEIELERLETQLDGVEEEIDSAEDQLKKRDQLEAQQAEIDDEIESLRSRIERLEAEAVEQFNEQMEAILDLLGYENLERIWIERIETDIQKGRSKEQTTSFDLHVVRTNESGSVYEDTIDHLSESEREVVGLVFALSGYLVHEVYDEMTFILLDSIEAFDSDRIAALVDHFAQYADYLVVALLPEDAAALDDDYQRIAEI